MRLGLIVIQNLPIMERETNIPLQVRRQLEMCFVDMQWLRRSQ